VWTLTEDGREVSPPGGYDGTAWDWELVNPETSARKVVRVKISGTAMATSNLPFRASGARASHGQSEVQRVLDWDEPPDEIEFYSTSNTPEIRGGDPGPEVKELSEITEWFEARGIWLVFSGHATLSPSGTVTYEVRTANLINREADEVVNRFESPFSRLEAARAAQQWWRDHREARPADLGDLSASGSSDASLILSAGQREVVKRHRLHLVYSSPAEGDPESGWMIEVYNDADELLGIAVGQTAEDALTTVLEDLLPPES
jgi:hypothetical protein